MKIIENVPFSSSCGGKKKDIFTNFAHNSQRMVMKTTDIYSGVHADFYIALSLHELHWIVQSATIILLNMEHVLKK